MRRYLLFSIVFVVFTAIFIQSGCITRDNDIEPYRESRKKAAPSPTAPTPSAPRESALLNIPEPPRNKDVGQEDMAKIVQRAQDPQAEEGVTKTDESEPTHTFISTDKWFHRAYMLYGVGEEALDGQLRTEVPIYFDTLGIKGYTVTFGQNRVELVIEGTYDVAQSCLVSTGAQMSQIPFTPFTAYLIKLNQKTVQCFEKSYVLQAAELVLVVLEDGKFLRIAKITDGEFQTIYKYADKAHISQPFYDVWAQTHKAKEGRGLASIGYIPTSPVVLQLPFLLAIDDFGF